MTRTFDRLPRSPRIAVAALLLAAGSFLPGRASFADEAPPEGWRERIAAELGAEGEARLPAGTYELDRPIVLKSYESLVLSPRATLIAKGFTAVILEGRRASLRGGTVRGDGSSVVLVRRSLFWSVEDCVIEGSEQLNVGLLVQGPECYFGQARNLEIRNVSHAVRLGKDANANDFWHVVAFDVGETFWSLDGAYANKVYGGFCHGSGTRDGAIGVRAMNGSIYNGFYGLGFEPGGERTRALVVDETSGRNHFFVQNNAIAAPSLRGKNDLVILDGDRLAGSGGDIRLATALSTFEESLARLERKSGSIERRVASHRRALEAYRESIEYLYGAWYGYW
ncbi:MAG TPA: hypothetical protein VGN57_21305 [Pirellulaceae bacterium]|jgi:hypothetical protein|nr:hypothetical protein [Pirellulaceae bacterium]